MQFLENKNSYIVWLIKETFKKNDFSREFEMEIEKEKKKKKEKDEITIYIIYKVKTIFNIKIISTSPTLIL